MIVEFFRFESRSIIYNFSIFKEDNDMIRFISINRKKLKFKISFLSKNLLRVWTQKYTRFICSYCMQWVKMHRNLKNSSFCNFKKSSTRTLCRLLIFLSINEHCSYQCKNLFFHIKSCRSYFINSFFSKIMKFEHVFLMILIKRF